MELPPVLFALYVIPGFIAVSVRDLLIPRRPRGELAFLAEVVYGSGAILGGVYALAWVARLATPQVGQFLYVHLPPHPFAVREDSPPWELLAIAVGLAFITGIAWAKWQGSSVRKALLLRTTGVALDPYPTVWPLVAQWAKREWVAVQLEDGTRYGGWIAKYSDEGEGNTDLVLDDAAILDTDNNLIRRIRGGMVYVRLSAVASIEFLSRSGYSPPRQSVSQGPAQQEVSGVPVTIHEITIRFEPDRAGGETTRVCVRTNYGTVEVKCTLDADELKRRVWEPVLEQLIEKAYTSRDE